MPKHVARPVVWPSAASAVVQLPVVAGKRAAASARVGGLPVTLSPVPVDELSGKVAASPLAVKVDVLDRTAASKAGVPLVVKLSRADGGSSAAKVNVRLDYNAFRDAYGGAWAARLELRQLPECGLSAIAADAARRRECAGIDLETTNDFRAGVLSADVDLAAPLKALSPKVLSERERALVGIEAVEPAASTSASTGTSFVVLSSSGNAEGIGTFNKSDLKATYAWNAGTNAGNFTFNYPMATAPVPGGLAPKLSLDYSSQAVDGETVAENIQSGLVGEGWGLTGGGYIESTYRPCVQDNSSDHPATWPVVTADPCWRYENYQLSWSGSSGELVPTGTAGVWKTADDDGSRVEYVTNIPNVGAHWKITTTDGTQWFFGRQRLPGWTAGGRETGSVLMQEVFANHSGEPCFHPSGYPYSHCTMPYRWNLDYVVDANGNSMSYWYTRFGNLAGSNNSGAGVFSYDRDAVLARIEYGTRAGNETSQTAPAVVEFTNSDRCVTNCGDHANWFDTPWDLKCDAAPCNGNLTPSYFTDRRLSKVATKVWTGTGTTYKTVDEWVLGHSFTGGTDAPVLWLDSVTRTGYDANGASQSTPPLTMHGFTARNRADYDPNASMADPIKTRIDYIDTETGGRIGVSYLPRDEPACTWWSGKAQSEWPNYNHNASRCFMQFVTNRSGASGWSWWHKFVVDKVTETDQVGGSPPMETSYSYSMEGAGSPSGHPLVVWSYASNPWGTVKKAMSTWRGYPTVVTSVGPAGGVQTRTKRLYYRGLDRDTGLDANQGQEFWRRATITDSQGTTVDDHQAMAGQVREETVYDGASESNAIGRTIHHLVATSTAGGVLPSWQTPPERYSYRTRQTSNKELTKIADGSWRATEVASTWDSYGSLGSTNDKGDIINGTLTDNICTRYEYTRNVNPNLLLRAGTGVGTVAAAYSGQMMSQNWSAYDIVFSPGDFTGDGKPDVIARNPSDGYLYRFNGDGAGGLSGGAVRIGADGWWGPSQVLDAFGADFTGDGKMDLMSRKTDGNLYVFPGNGDGTYNEYGWIAAGTGGWWNTTVVLAITSVGDFNGDGKADVITRQNDGNMYVFPGLGNGTLNQYGWWQIGSGQGGITQLFGRGDFDGDGKADILGRDPVSSHLLLYKGTGTGLVSGAPVSLGGGWLNQTSMMLGDFTGDGKPDVVSRDNLAWITGAVQRVSAVNADCGTTPVLPANFVSDVRTIYDNESYDRAPIRGLVTRTETVKSFTGSTPTGFAVTTADHDKYGRTIWAKDPLGYQTSTAYTHNTAGLLASTKVTNPRLHDTTVATEPLRGLALTVTDPNGKVTTAEYDPLGRLTKVWQPGRPTGQTPNVEYVYNVSKTAPPYVLSKALGPNGNQIASYEILDGFLRARQTQTVTEDGKRSISDTQYDQRGLAVKSSTFYNNASGPAAALVTFNDVDVPSQTRTVYDSAGRATASELWSGNLLQWRTATAYGGDRTTVDQPLGGTDTTTKVDARGRATELVQYHSFADYTELVAGDFTNDGKVDMFGIQPGTGRRIVFYGQGNNTFIPSTTFLSNGWDTLRNWVAGRFDNDTNLDVVGIRKSDGALMRYQGNGAGSLTNAVQVGSGYGIYSELAGGDFNGDGYTDLAGIRASDGKLFYIQAASGGGAFNAAVDLGTGWSGLSHLVGGDANGDGKADLLAIRNSDNMLRRALGNGNGTFAAATDLFTGWKRQNLAAGDFNGDGKVDLFGAYPSDQRDPSLKRWTGDGTTFSSFGSLPLAAGQAFDRTIYGYDNADRLTSMTDPAGNTWTYEYDLLGRKKKTVDPDAGTSTSTYDDAGQVTTATDARLQTLFFEYDSLGRKTKERDTDASGTVLAEWKYDTAFKGQLDEAIRYVGADAYKTRVTDRDDSYRPKHSEVVIPNATLNGSLAATYGWDSTYKVNGAQATSVLPGVGGLPAETLTYGYDDNGFAQTISGNQMYVADTFYAHDGIVTGQVLGETGKRVKLEKTLDPATRRTSKQWIYTEQLSNPNNFILPHDFTYGYDQAGTITSVEGNHNATPDQKECFSYDYLRRLTEAWTQTNGFCTTPQRAGADPYRRQWSFDTIGNRLTQVDKDPVAGDTTWSYTVGTAGSVKPHQLKTVTANGPRADTATRTFEYDDAGNTKSAVTTTGVAQTLTWDKEGHLATVVAGSTTSSHLYSADGSRLIVRTPDKTTLYLPDGTELELPSAGGAALGTRYYAGIAVRSAAGVTWTSPNHQGTNTIQIDSVTLTTSQRRSMPYGEDRTSTPSGWVGTKGYVGGTKDASTYTHLGARDYDPTLGRFISTDPILDLADPNQWNAYGYANASPVSGSDPTGLKTDWDEEKRFEAGASLSPAPKAAGSSKKKKKTSSIGGAIGAGAAAGASAGNGVGGFAFVGGAVGGAVTNKRLGGFGGGALAGARGLAGNIAIGGVAGAGWIGLDCHVPFVSCGPSTWETTTANGMMIELWDMVRYGVPEPLREKVVELCKNVDCKGIGPAQLAWCAYHIESCLLVWQAKERAQSASLDLIAGEGGENSRLRNAVRHSLWIALMIGEYGISEHDALLFGIAHEMDNGGDNGWTTSDSKIDRHNNFIGAQVGSDVRQWKASNPSGSAYDEAVQRILDLTATSNSCSSCLNLTGST